MIDRQSDRILVEADDVTPDVLRAVEETLDWFNDDSPLPVEEFIDRLCDSYADGWDIEDYSTPAVRKIMRHARKIRRDSA